MADGSVTNKDLYDAIKELGKELRLELVSNKEFAPVKAISYGLVGAVVLYALQAILKGAFN